MTKSIKIRNNFQFLTVAYQNENITLMNETNIGFGSATYLTGTVGFFLAAEVVKRIAFAKD